MRRRHAQTRAALATLRASAKRCATCESWPTLPEALPASGDELASLLEQLASSGAHGARVRAAAGAH